MSRAYSATLAPATIDTLILAGLRGARGPVEEGEIPDRCHIRYQTLPAERTASLDRLVGRGLVVRQEARKLHPSRPLLEWTEVILYRATEGGIDVR